MTSFATYSALLPYFQMWKWIIDNIFPNIIQQVEQFNLMTRKLEYSVVNTGLRLISSSVSKQISCCNPVHSIHLLITTSPYKNYLMKTSYNLYIEIRLYIGKQEITLPAFSCPLIYFIIFTRRGNSGVNW